MDEYPAFSEQDRRIHCANCGKLFGAHECQYRLEMVEIGEPVAEYDGPLLLLKEVIDPPLPPLGQKDDPGTHAFPMDEPPSRQYSDTKLVWHFDYKGRRGRKVIRWLWDGVSWLKPTSQFCSIECQRIKAPTFWQQVAERNQGKE